MISCKLLEKWFSFILFGLWNQWLADFMNNSYSSMSMTLQYELIMGLDIKLGGNKKAPLIILPLPALKMRSGLLMIYGQMDGIGFVPPIVLCFWPFNHWPHSVWSSITKNRCISTATVNWPKRWKAHGDMRWTDRWPWVAK